MKILIFFFHKEKKQKTIGSPTIATDGSYVYVIFLRNGFKNDIIRTNQRYLEVMPEIWYQQIEWYLYFYKMLKW